MPSFDFTSPDGKKYTVDGPDGSTKEQAFGILQKRIGGKSATPATNSGAEPIPGFKTPAQAETPKDPSDNWIQGGAETLLSGLTGAVAAPVGAAAGVVKGLTGGKYGTPEGARDAADFSKRVSGAMTYEPKSKTGQEYTAALGEGLSESKLAGLGPMAADLPFGGVKPAARGIQSGAKEAMRADAEFGAPPAITSAKAPMGAAGAESTAAETLRRERAAGLPVPIKLMKGQAVTGDERFGLQRFERETAKDEKLGKDLRERYADQTEAIPKNFDAWLEQTGSESPSVRSTGKSVDTALRAKVARMKGEIYSAYTKARAAGEMEEKVDIAPIQQYLSQMKPQAINAGVLTAADGMLSALAKEGKISLAELEEVRKQIGVLGSKDAPNSHFAGEIKSQIDAATEGKGGALYKQARAMYAKYAEEFKDRAVVSKLLSTKPGSADRAVAFEDVFKHSILSGSLDDVRAIRRTLQTEGDIGRQAWKDLQGETVRHMKEQMTKGAGRDIRGNEIVSPKGMDNVVREMDKDGKLDFIFGKKGAQQIRDINEVVKDSYSVPAGAVNTSGTASVLMSALGEMATGGFSLGTAKLLGQLKKTMETRSVKKRVAESLADPSQIGPPP